MIKTRMAGAGRILSRLFPYRRTYVPATGVRKRIENAAHRGASGFAPENTLAAFDLALEMKADYIEVDVQRTKDGELVIIHDTKVDRTTNGTGYVWDYSLEELKKLDAGQWKGRKFAGEQIPTLREVLDRYGGKVGFLIELKEPGFYPGIEKQVAELIREYNFERPQKGKVIIQSFSYSSIKKMKELLPDVPVGILAAHKSQTTMENLLEVSVYADWFNPHYSIVTKELVEQVHSLGMKMASWTARSRKATNFLLDMGVDTIITDYPDYVSSRIH